MLMLTRLRHREGVGMTSICSQHLCDYEERPTTTSLSTLPLLDFSSFQDPMRFTSNSLWVYICIALRDCQLAQIFVQVGLDPPIRQGQTRYPFLVMLFSRDEEVDVELNIDEFVALLRSSVYQAITYLT